MHLFVSLIIINTKKCFVIRLKINRLLETTASWLLKRERGVLCALLLTFQFPSLVLIWASFLVDFRFWWPFQVPSLVWNWANRIISCKINPISASKLCKDDMKIIQLFRRFPHKVKLFHVQTLHNFLFVLYTGEKNGYFN